MTTVNNRSHHHPRKATKLSASYRFNRQTVLLVAGFVAAAGFVLLLAHASGVFVTTEAESGSKSGPVANVADQSASGGSAIVFNAPTVSPPPPPTPPPTPPTGGVSTCDPSKGMAVETCWATSTGVLNTTTADPNDRWSEAQILAGQASAQLAHVSGVQVLNAGGTIQNKWITGCIEVRGSNVTINNVYIEYNGAYCSEYPNYQESSSPIHSPLNHAPYFTGIHITNTEVKVADVPSNTVQAGIVGSGIIGDSVNVHGGHVMVWSANSSWTNLYSHDQSSVPPNCPHAEAFRTQDADNVSLTHSFLAVGHSTIGNQNCSSGAYLSGPSSDNVSFDNVYMYGGDNVCAEPSSPPSPPAGWLQNTKFRWRNTYCDDRSGSGGAGGGFAGFPDTYTDYVSGTNWTFSYDASGIPQNTDTRCTNLYSVSAAGVPTKRKC